MAQLPIVQYEETIIKAVEKNPVTVVIGETGSGKNTQFSQMLHKTGYTNSGIIAITQPRRVAAEYENLRAVEAMITSQT